MELKFQTLQILDRKRLELANQWVQTSKELLRRILKDAVTLQDCDFYQTQIDVNRLVNDMQLQNVKSQIATSTQ